MFKKTVRGLAYNAIVGSMYAFPKLKYNIIYNGLKNFTNTPPTLILCSHKRNADPMIAFPTLYYKKGFPKIHFVAQHGLFLQGLPNFQKSFPPFVGLALFSVNMRKPLTLLNMHPICNPKTTTVREFLTDIKDNLGDYYLDDILNEKWNFLFYALRPGENKNKLRVSDVIRRHYNKVLKEASSPGILLRGREFINEVKQMEREIIKEQESVFIDILNNGGTLCLFPEGELTKDGKLAKIKAGLYDILSQTKSNIRLLPMNITYDFMYTARRINAHINFGKEYIPKETTSDKAIDDFVEQEIKNLTTITPSNLFSYYLCKIAEENKDMSYIVIKKDKMKKRLFGAFDALKKQNYFIDDKMLRKEAFDKRLNGYLVYCSFFMKPFLNWRANDIILDNRRILDSEVNYKKNPVRYCTNEVSHFKILEQLLD